MSVLENAMVGQHCRIRSGLLGAVLRPPRTRAEEQAVREQARSALSFFGTRLASFREDQPAMALSYANWRRLEIARAMATNPKLILLDEPTAGMNPKETQEMIGLIGKLRDERGFTIVVIEHDMRLVKGVSDRVVALDYGAQDRRRHLRRGVQRRARDRGVPRQGGGAGRMSDGPILELRNVTTHYGLIAVLREVSLEIYPGEIVCLLGGNASGKSTTLRTILGSDAERG
jgi:ABC-type branched-subunit amino acid transport system ATPase component